LCIANIWRGGNVDGKLQRWRSRHGAPIQYTYDVIRHSIT
jgi:hypothetical protein